MKYNFGVDKFRKTCKAYKLHAELENLREQLAESERHRQILTQHNVELLERVKTLEAALNRLVSVAERCDSWESFPDTEIEAANEVLVTQ